MIGSTEVRMVNRDDVIALLEEKNIAYESVKHKAVFSIGEMESVHLENSERIAKNLFLRDDKKREYYLVSIRNDRIADLKALRLMIGSRPLSFASEENLESILCLSKGEVTPFGLLNDSEHRTKFILDSYFVNGLIGIHPNDNSETVFLKVDDLFLIFKESGIDYIVVDFD